MKLSPLDWLLLGGLVLWMLTVSAAVWFVVATLRALRVWQG